VKRKAGKISSYQLKYKHPHIEITPELYEKGKWIKPKYRVEVGKGKWVDLEELERRRQIK
jgi:hypothetical protein